MYSTSSNSSSTLDLPETSPHGLKGHSSNGGESYTTEYPYFSRSSILSSPAMHSRPHPLYQPSSPSRPSYHSHSQSFHSDYASPQSSSNSEYSHYSPYARRSSSPLTSSSPAPITSPLFAPTHLSGYGTKVKIVGRDLEESYPFHDPQHDSDSSRFFRRADEDNWRPKLPSFKSLFGKSEHNSSTHYLQHPRQTWDDLHSDSLSPSPGTILPPLNFPPSMRIERGHRHTASSSSSTDNTYSMPADTRRYAATSPPAAADAGAQSLQSQKSSRAGAKAVLSELNDTFIHSGRKQCQSDLTFPVRPENNLSHQTPTRHKHLFSDAGSTPNTAEETRAKFLSPIKGSPYPRRTYFLVSSERGRCSPERNDTRCALLHLAEIAEKARSDVPKAAEPKVALEQMEESTVDSASSPFSSPAVYQSSLPPSSPPTSEAQLSPLLYQKELSPTDPLADVINLTVESRVNDRFENEAHQLPKPTVAFSSHLEDDSGKNAAPIMDHATPVAIVSVQNPISTISLDNSNDEAPSHGLSAVPSPGNMDSNESGSMSLLLQTPGSNAVVVAEVPEVEKAVDCEVVSSTKDQSSLSSSTVDVVEPVLPDSDTVSIPISMVSSVPVLSFHNNSETTVSDVGHKYAIKQSLGKNTHKAKTKTISTAPPIASSAPRVTVTVVKRMKPVLNSQRSVARSLPVKSSALEKTKEKGPPASVPARGKGRDVLKTKTSEAVNSHSLAPKRPRESDLSPKDLVKSLEVPPKKKAKIASEEAKSPSSTFAEVIPTSYGTSSPTSASKPSSILPVKRKAGDEVSSPPLTHPVSTKSGILLCASPIVFPSSPKTPKKQKVMILELPIYPKRKLGNPPRAAPSPPREPDSATMVDERWVNALAAAYGTPAGRGTDSTKLKLTPQRSKEVVAERMSESDLTSDEDEDEEVERKVPKMKSPRLTKRMIIESDSEEDDSEMEEEVNTRRQPSRRRVVEDSSDSEAGEEVSSDEEEEEKENVTITKKKHSTTGKSDHSTQAYTKSQTSKSLFPPPSPLDLELVGIIIEAMTLTRSSSHLASTLYRTVHETRSGVFSNIMKANSAHFDAVTQSLRSQGLQGLVNEGPTGKGRPKRGAAANEEGGIAGLSEEDIVWVSEFERVMVESANRYGMFGKVESSFRNDPRDRPLPFSSRFFYIPDHDPDTERAQLIKLTMPGSGKRTETMKYKQYYWKPVGK